MKLNRLRRLFKRKDSWLLQEAFKANQNELRSLKQEVLDLRRGNQILKGQHESLLLTQDSQLKTDLNEAINIIIDYQKTLSRVGSPDPTIQRANNLLNKWNLKSQQTPFKIFIGEEEITMGRQF